MGQGSAKLLNRKILIAEYLSVTPPLKDSAIAKIAGTSVDAVRFERLQIEHPELSNCIYFAQSTAENGVLFGPIKIGWSDYVPYRLRKLQRQVPFKMTALCIKKTNKKEEKEIHKQFNHLRINWGEWFKPEKVLIDFIHSIDDGQYLINKYPKLFLTESGI